MLLLNIQWDAKAKQNPAEPISTQDNWAVIGAFCVLCIIDQVSLGSESSDLLE